MNHGLCVWWSDTRGVSLSTPLRTSPQPLMRTTLIPNGGTSKGCGSSPSSVLGHRAIRTAKGSNYGPQKGQTTDRKRVKLRTAKGSPRTERSQHGPKRPQDHEHEPSSSSRLPYRSCGATYARHFVLRQRQHEPFTITTFDFLAYVSCCADTYPTLRWHDTRGYPTLNLETC